MCFAFTKQVCDSWFFKVSFVSIKLLSIYLLIYNVFAIGEKRFIAPHQAVTVINTHNAVRVKFNTGQSNSAVIAYDIV